MTVMEWILLGLILGLPTVAFGIACWRWGYWRKQTEFESSQAMRYFHLAYGWERQWANEVLRRPEAETEFGRLHAEALALAKAWPCGQQPHALTPNEQDHEAQSSPPQA